MFINAAQVLANEVEKQGKFQPKITVRISNNGDFVKLMIEDNGAGIDESAMDHIFEPFFTTKKVGEGTGLGLWLCWSIIVERHQGHIRAENIPEGGARFIIELPVAPGFDCE